MLSTWLVSPNLKLEKNPILRGLSWKEIGWINVGVIVLTLTLGPVAVWAVVGISLVAAALNLIHFWRQSG